jgi:hypothetical protein
MIVMPGQHTWITSAYKSALTRYRKESGVRDMAAGKEGVLVGRRPNGEI